MSRRQDPDTGGFNPDGDGSRWTFLSNHAHALLCLVVQPDIRLWELAAAIGVRERSAQRIVTDLVNAGYVSRERRGARVHYTVHTEQPMRRPELGNYTIGDLLKTLHWEPAPTR